MNSLWSKCRIIVAGWSYTDSLLETDSFTSNRHQTVVMGFTIRVNFAADVPDRSRCELTPVVENELDRL